ncbi:MAG: hypothetical protein M3Y50_13560 [Acidobacteriota bacterium]|nr:hypothetical protein [Acidobacteriota bacterium]
MQKRPFLASIATLLLCIPGAVAQQQFANAQPRAPSVKAFSGFFSTPAGSSSSAADASSKAEVLIHPIPATAPAAKLSSSRALRSLAIGLTASTLGAGIEVATPLSRSFNLRSAINVFTFAYPFSLDGVGYDPKVHLKSVTATIDWFPWHGGFHISPGILYAKNNFDATVSVAAGQNFELGPQSFLNSVADPLHGTAALVFPHAVSPMLMMGFGNVLPRRSSRHISVPFEFGVAYTGAAVIRVNLDGTVCTSDGCLSFASYPEAQSSLRQEINDLNEILKRVPVYPIVSVGFAYRF